MSLKSKTNSRKSKKIMKGGEPMPLYTTTSPDWHDPQQPAPLAVDLDVGINEYQFGRTTPDNKFVVATGLVDNPQGVEMVGGKKSTDKKKKMKKSTTKKPKTIVNKVISGSKNLFEKTKKAIMGDEDKKKVKKVDKKKTVTKKPVTKKTVTKKPAKNTRSIFNKIKSGTVNLYQKVKTTIVGDEKKSKKSKSKKSKSKKSVKTVKK